MQTFLSIVTADTAIALTQNEISPAICGPQSNLLTRILIRIYQQMEAEAMCKEFLCISRPVSLALSTLTRVYLQC